MSVAALGDAPSLAQALAGVKLPVAKALALPRRERLLDDRLCRSRPGGRKARRVRGTRGECRSENLLGEKATNPRNAAGSSRSEHLAPKSRVTQSPAVRSRSVVLSPVWLLLESV